MKRSGSVRVARAFPSKLKGRLAPVAPGGAGVRRTGDSSFDYRGPLLYFDGTNEGQAGNVDTHELSHYLLHLHTPYGLFLDTLTGIKTHQVLAYAHECPLPRVPYPVLAFAEKLREPGLGFELPPNVSATELRRVVKRRVEPWSWWRALELALEGDSRTLVESDAVAALAAAEIEQHRNFDASLEESGVQLGAPESALNLSDEPERPACPTVTWPDGYTTAVGARHVFEGVANQIERMDHHDQVDLILSRKGAPYTALFMDLLQWHRSVLKLIDEAGATWGEYLFNTFLALAELSLYTPIGCLYARLRRPGMTWDDIHPVLRYRRSLDTIVKVHWLYDRDAWNVYQDAVCRELEWPSPREFLHLGAALKSDTPFLARHAAACGVRLKHAADLVDINSRQEDLQALLQDKLPLVWRHGKLWLPAEKNEMVSAIAGYFVHHLTDAVMEEEAIDYASLLPPGSLDHPEIQTEGGLLALLLATMPNLAPPRLVPLHLFLSEHGG